MEPLLYPWVTWVRAPVEDYLQLGVVHLKGRPGRALVGHEKSVGDCVEGRGYYYSQTFYPMYIDVREFVFVFVSLFEFAF